MRAVKLVEELCYEDVHLKHIGDILALNVTQHVNEPLKLAVCRANPQEVHLMRREEQGIVFIHILIISSPLTHSFY